MIIFGYELGSHKFLCS